MTLTLLADIGGTNTRVALARAGQLLPDTIRRYPNDHHPALEPILAAYLAEEDARPIIGACVAAAGPVRDGVATMTNLDWRITPEGVAGATGAMRVAVLNDLQAQGHALGSLGPEALQPILPGAPAAPGASALVIGIGTGFNAAPVHETPGGRFVAASECGHVTLPLRCDEDIRLMRFLVADHGFASVEDVLSGRGIAAIHAFLRAETGHGAPRDAASIMTAVATGDALSQATLRIFVRLLAGVIGDLALTHLPFGGIYLCGGVARAVAPYLATAGFARALRDKGRFSDFLAAFPVTAIADDYAALAGCAAYLQASHGESRPARSASRQS